MHRPFLHKKHREFIRDIAERRHVMLAGDHLGRGVAWRAARGFQERALRVPARKKIDSRSLLCHCQIGEHFPNISMFIFLLLADLFQLSGISPRFRQKIL